MQFSEATKVTTNHEAHDVVSFVVLCVLRDLGTQDCDDLSAASWFIITFDLMHFSEATKVTTNHEAHDVVSTARRVSSWSNANYQAHTQAVHRHLLNNKLKSFQ